MAPPRPPSGRANCMIAREDAVIHYQDRMIVKDRTTAVSQSGPAHPAVLYGHTRNRHGGAECVPVANLEDSKVRCVSGSAALNSKSAGTWTIDRNISRDDDFAAREGDRAEHSKLDCVAVDRGGDRVAQRLGAAVVEVGYDAIGRGGRMQDDEKQAHGEGRGGNKAQKRVSIRRIRSHPFVSKSHPLITRATTDTSACRNVSFGPVHRHLQRPTRPWH